MDYKRRKSQSHVNIQFRNALSSLKFQRNSLGLFVCFCGNKYVKPQAFQHHAKRHCCLPNTSPIFQVESIPKTQVGNLQAFSTLLQTSSASVTEMSHFPFEKGTLVNNS